MEAERPDLPLARRPWSWLVRLIRCWWGRSLAGDRLKVSSLPPRRLCRRLLQGFHLLLLLLFLLFLLLLLVLLLLFLLLVFLLLLYLLLLLICATFSSFAPWDGVPRTQKLKSPLLIPQSCQRLSLWEEPGAGQNIALHASSTARKSTSLVSAFVTHSPSFVAPIFQHKLIKHVSSFF